MVRQGRATSSNLLVDGPDQRAAAARLRPTRGAWGNVPWIAAARLRQSRQNARRRPFENRVGVMTFRSEGCRLWLDGEFRRLGDLHVRGLEIHDAALPRDAHKDNISPYDLVPGPDEELDAACPAEDHTIIDRWGVARRASSRTTPLRLRRPAKPLPSPKGRSLEMSFFSRARCTLLAESSTDQCRSAL